MPSALKNLTTLRGGQGDFRWNALESNDVSMDAYLRAKQDGGDWRGTQTAPPPYVIATARCPGTAEVAWELPLYVPTDGFCRVYDARSATGPFVDFVTTATRQDSAAIIEGINPSFFNYAVQSVTLPHEHNPNTVESALSDVLDATPPTVSLAQDDFETAALPGWHVQGAGRME